MRLFNISPRTFARWTEEGLPVAERGRGGHASLYDEAEVRAWLKAREQAAPSSTAGGALAEVARERARKERAQAVLAEQLAASRARELLPRAEVRKAWDGIVTAVRTALLAAPSNYSDRLIRAYTLGGEQAHEQAFGEAMAEVCRELAGHQADATPQVEEEAAPSRRGRKAKGRAA